VREKVIAAFPNDDSVYRLIYLGPEQIRRKWTTPIKNWKAALHQFAILYEDRLPFEALCTTRAVINRMYGISRMWR